MYEKQNKYLSIKRMRGIRKHLRGFSIRELKDLILKLIPLEKAPFKYIRERDMFKCRFCGSRKDVEIHHITPKSIEGTNHEFNLITLCKACHMFIHCNPQGRLSKSKLVKDVIIKKNGKTFSKYGRKWGRKTISTQKKNKVLELAAVEPKLTLRYISEQSGVSLGCVHKTIKESTGEHLNYG